MGHPSLRAGWPVSGKSWGKKLVMESPEKTNFGKSPRKSLKSHGKIFCLSQFRQLMQVSLQNRGMMNFFYHCIVTVLFYGGPSSQCVLIISSFCSFQSNFSYSGLVFASI